MYATFMIINVRRYFKRNLIVQEGYFMLLSQKR